MYVLGLGDHISCGTALLEDGKIVAAVNDERLVREKMVFGVPRESIEAVLALTGVRPDQVDLVAVGTRNQQLVPDYVDFRGGWFGLERAKSKKLLFDVGSRVAKLHDYLPGLEKAYYLMRAPGYAARRRALGTILRDEFEITAPVQFIDHHYCHATSAYYSSGFGPDATIITMDGGGDGKSAKAYAVQNGRFTELVAVSSYDSLGNLYAYVTEICGFKAGRHEGKITGLAAHGEPIFEETLDKLVTYRDGSIVNVGNIFFHSALDELRSRLPADFDRADLSASVQAHAERLAFEFSKYWLARTGFSDIALAGGLFANVRINQKIHEIPDVERCFIHPGMTDCGIPVGAALAAYYDRDPRPAVDTRCLEDVYLGPAYSDSEIEAALKSSGVEHSRPDDLEREVAQLLAGGEVVAWFDGRMEYGPRALGSRSILYQTTDPSANDWLNKALSRTEFMPFAPATLEEEASRCYRSLAGAERTSRFMTMTFDCTDWMKANCPGVVHIDGTARPQIVRRQDNPRYYRVIEEYHRLTGLPSVINTSFNMHEEPIVCSPEDAIRAFRLGHLDYLAIGGFLAKGSDVDRGERERTGETIAAASRADRGSA